LLALVGSLATRREMDMADSAVFVGWGGVIPGREKQANQVFGEAMQLFATLQQRGSIESFEPVALEPHGGDLGGYCIVRGGRAQLSAMRFSAEFQRLIARAQVVVQNFGVVDAHIGKELQDQYDSFAQIAADLT
jgi:hypothetical protein